MANEITVSTKLLLTNGSLKENKGATGNRVDQTTAVSEGGVQVIGTSAENITYGDVTTPRWALFQNLDDTNYVEIGIDATGFQPVVKLEAGDPPIILKIADSAQLQAKANTASINLNKLILDE